MIIHALLAFGILIMPWRFSMMVLALLTLAAGIGLAVILTALLGWLLLFLWCWRYA